MKRRILLSSVLLLCLTALSSTNAQLNPKEDHTGVVDLSDVTDAYVQNMKLLKTRVPEADIRDQMDAVIAQAEDLGSFFRAKGTASRRRALFEEQEGLKFKKDLSKSDMRKLDELRKEIRELDPENYFSTARKLYNETQNELRGQLELVQTSDPVRKDVIRLIRQHLATYNKALQEY